MWAVRRASTQLRNQGLTSRTGRICCAKTEIAKCYSETCNAGIIEPQEKNFDVLLSSARFYRSSARFLKSPKDVCFFSSQADKRGRDDEDLEDDSSELKTSQDTVKGFDEDAAASELSEEEEGIADELIKQLEASDMDTATGEKKAASVRYYSEKNEMTKAILASPALPVSKVLDKWVEQGNEVTQREALITMLQLRKRALFAKALELSEWLESTKQIEFTEANYAAHVDLIIKSKGVKPAEEYIKQIPESFRTELVYCRLLAIYIGYDNHHNSFFTLFEKMKTLGFPLTCLTYNQLLLLYKRTKETGKNIICITEMMEKIGIKPSLLTYRILIDINGRSNDITGMEQIVEKMKSEGFKPDDKIQASLALYYARSGAKDKAMSSSQKKKDKAMAILKELEGADLKKNRHLCKLLFPVYASLGSKKDVNRIWKICKSNPQIREYIAAIDAWCQLKNLKRAEKGIVEMMNRKPSLDLLRLMQSQAYIAGRFTQRWVLQVAERCVQRYHHNSLNFDVVEPDPERIRYEFSSLPLGWD